MDKRTIEEIRKDIDKNKEQLAEIEEEIDALEYEFNHLKYRQEDLEETQSMLLEELYDTYPLLSFTDETRKDISGQFERDGKWKLCNGFVLIESDNKFEDIEESAGIDITIEKLTKDMESIDIELDEICEENKTNNSNYQVYILKGLHFQQCYIDRVIDFMGKENITSITIYKQQLYNGAKAGNLLIKSKDTQVLILGVRTREEQ